MVGTFASVGAVFAGLASAGPDNVVEHSSMVALAAGSLAAAAENLVKAGTADAAGMADIADIVLAETGGQTESAHLPVEIVVVQAVPFHTVQSVARHDALAKEVTPDFGRRWTGKLPVACAKVVLIWLEVHRG